MARGGVRGRIGLTHGIGYGGGQLSKRDKVEEGNTRAQRRADDDGGVYIQGGGVRRRYERQGSERKRIVKWSDSGQREVRQRKRKQRMDYG